jgi:hypothetical protein
VGLGYCAAISIGSIGLKKKTMIVWIGVGWANSITSSMNPYSRKFISSVTSSRGAMNAPTPLLRELIERSYQVNGSSCSPVITCITRLSSVLTMHLYCYRPTPPSLARSVFISSPSGRSAKVLRGGAKGMELPFEGHQPFQAARLALQEHIQIP